VGGGAGGWVGQKRPYGTKHKIKRGREVGEKDAFFFILTPGWGRSGGLKELEKKKINGESQGYISKRTEMCSERW